MLTRSICATAICLFLFDIAEADDQIRATQEELRRRNVYFGDIDGRPSNETAEALKRYQKRKGFAPSGQADSVTLRSLGLLARQPGEAAPKELPEEPVLKSDVVVNATVAAKEVSAETGVSVSTLLPNAAPSNRRPRGGAAPTPAGRKLPEPVHGSSRGIFGRESSGRTQTQVLTDAEVGDMVKNYLEAASGSRVEEEIRFLADRVDYAGHGALDRRIVERTLRDYYARWPKRHYRLISPVLVRRESRSGLITAAFVTEFSLKRGSTSAKGRTQNQVIFNAATSDPRIISFKERRISKR